MITSRSLAAIGTCLAMLIPALDTEAGPAADARIESLAREIHQAPDSQQLYLKRALVYSDNGQLEQALADIAMAGQLGPEIDTVLVHGIVLYREGRFPEAQQQLDRYLARYPGHTGALQYRARLLRDAGDPAALADYEKLLALQPNQDPGIYLAAARLMVEQPQRGATDALALLDSRIATVGAIPQLQRYAIKLQRQQGNYADAIARLATLDSKTRSTAAWHLEVAELLLLDNQAGQAAPHLDIAAEQLARQRPTAARAELQQKLVRLQGHPELDH